MHKRFSAADSAFSCLGYTVSLKVSLSFLQLFSTCCDQECICHINKVGSLALCDGDNYILVICGRSVKYLFRKICYVLLPKCG